MLNGEFVSLKEPTEVSEFAADTVFPADGHKFIKSKRQTEPKDPTRKLRLPIIKYNS
jgi:hypothetical protein